MTVINMVNNPINSQQLLNMAMRAMQSGQFNQALSLFTRLEKLNIIDPRLFRSMGAVHERLHHHSQAITYFKRSLELMPGQSDLYCSMGNIELRRGNTQKALLCYQQAVELAQNQPLPWLKLGQCYLLLDRPSEAQEAFKKTLALDNSVVEAIIGIARCERAQGGHEEGERLLTVALDKHPENNVLMSELAWWYKESGQFKPAIRLFEILRLKADKNVDSSENLALAYLLNDQYEDALLVLDEGLKVAPTSIALHKLMASLKFELGHPEPLESYHSVIHGEVPDALVVEYFQMLLKLKRGSTAKQFLDNLAQQKGKQVLWQQLLLSFWVFNNEHQRVIDHLRGLHTNTASLDVSQQQMLAITYLAQKQAKQAIATLTPLRKRFPNDQFYLALYTTALRLKGDEEYQRLCNYDDLVFEVPLDLLPEQGSIEQFNQRVKAALDKLHTTKQNPLDQSLLHGTQTTGELFSRQIPEIQELRSTLQRTVVKALAQLKPNKHHPIYKYANNTPEFSASWSVKLGNQGLHVPHVHPKGWYSSAYYVDLPNEINDDSKQGWLHLGRPGIAMNEPLEARRWIKPKVGTLVLFPSYFWHGTEPFESKKTRMTVAFDLVPK